MGAKSPIERSETALLAINWGDEMDASRIFGIDVPYVGELTNVETGGVRCISLISLVLI